MKLVLTEEKFKSLLSEMVKEVLLLEAKMSLDDIYNKYYTDIDKETFLAAVNADPTSKRKENNIIGIGEYTKWILKLVKQGNWKPGDSFETTDLLGKFNKHKSKLPAEQRDLNKYSSVSELYNILQPYLNIQTRSEIKQKEATKVYEDEQWLIIIPHTEKAACRYGANTKWCTAAKEDNRFDYYNNRGPLYINIYRPKNRKYQFHFESEQFMNEKDNPIKPKKLPWTEGALNYYKSINKYVYLMYDSVKAFDNGIARVELNGQWNWFSLEIQELVSPNQWFDFVYDFDDNGIARVNLNDKWTWFSLKKQDYLFPNKWFKYVDDFDSNGIAEVKLNDKWNWFDKNKNNGQGGFVWDKPIEQWFGKVDNFDKKGIARVELNDKQTWFSLKKQDYLFQDKWFDSVSYFDFNGIAVVKLNGKYTWFSLKKQDYLFQDKWFDWVDKFDSNGIARVKLNDIYYDFNLDGQLLDRYTKQPLSQEEVQELFQQQQVSEMVNRLVKNYLR